MKQHFLNIKKLTGVDVYVMLALFFCGITVSIFYYFYNFFRGDSFRTMGVFLAELIGLSPYIYFIIGISIDKKWILTILNINPTFYDNKELSVEGACSFAKFNCLWMGFVFVLQSDFKWEIYSNYTVMLISIYVFTYSSANILTKIAGMYHYLIDFIGSYTTEGDGNYKNYNITNYVKANKMNTKYCFCLKTSILVLIVMGLFVRYCEIGNILFPGLLATVVIVVAVILLSIFSCTIMVEFLIINNLLFFEASLCGNLNTNQLDSMKQSQQCQLNNVQLLLLLLLIVNWFAVRYVLHNFVWG